MGRARNAIRKIDVRLKPVVIDRFGKTYAVEKNCDGFPYVDVIVTEANSEIRRYIEGDLSVTVFGIPSNVTKICENALSSFPAIEKLFLFSTQLVIFADDFSYLEDLDKIYVPSNLLNQYKSYYPTLASKFDIIVTDYVFTVPYVGNSTLTMEYLDEVFGIVTRAERNAVSKLIIPSDFDTDVDDTVMKYNFTEIFPNLNNNVWHDDYDYDLASLTEYTIEGSGELTVALVNALPISSDKRDNISKVIVPVDFTSYESGSIAKIEQMFRNMEVLKTCYEEGNIELDMNGDIVAKIISINKTVDEALVYARSVNMKTKRSNDTNLIIVPPTNNISFNSGYFSGCSNLVYIDELKGTGGNIYGLFTSCTNLVKVKNITFTTSVLSYYDSFSGCSSLKDITLTLEKGDSGATGAVAFNVSDISLEKIILTGKLSSFHIRNTTLTRQALVDLLNSLGTPTTQQTINIDASTLSKLTNDDIQIAYDKNWALSPTPEAFTMTINSTYYLVNFGTTWETYANASTDFYVENNKVYWKNKLVQGVLPTDLIRYGDDYVATYYEAFEYDGIEAPTYTGYDVTYYSDAECTTEVLESEMTQGTTYYSVIEWNSDTLTIAGSGTLTADIVNTAIKKTLPNTSIVKKVVVPNTFTSFENNSLDVIDDYNEINNLTLETNCVHDKNILSNWSASTGKIIHLICKSLTAPAYNSNRFIDCDSLISLEVSYTSYGIFSDLNGKFVSGTNLETLKMNNITNPSRNMIMGNLPKIKEIYSGVTNSTDWSPIRNIGSNSRYVNFYAKDFLSYTKINFFSGSYIKLFLNNSNATTSGFSASGLKTYVNAKDLVYYKSISGFSNQTGIIDGNGVYTDKGFTYPTLTGIDTEANIQLLTPSDNSLYLASDTGDLWQYTSGAWVNLFDNLIPTWYSDEDCTTAIADLTQVTTSDTIYVKGVIYGYDFANDSWANIKKAYVKGVAHYNLGDTKTITYNSATYTIRICDIGARYDITNGNGAKNHATFEFVELVMNNGINNTRSNIGGFALSNAHTTLLPNIFNNLPSDLKSVIEQVEISSASKGGSDATLTWSNNYLFLASNYELFGSSAGGSSLEQSTKYGLYATGISTLKYNLGSSSANGWFTRSPWYNDEASYVSVRWNGSQTYQLANYDGYGISPFFCL